MSDFEIEVSDINFPKVVIDPETFTPNREPATMRVLIRTPNGVEAAHDKIIQDRDGVALQIGNAILEAIRCFRETK